MDFTLKTYQQLLFAFQQAKYTFLRYEDYCRIKQSGKALPERFVILRHDVDELAENALKMAQTEHKFGVCATYYFRTVLQSNKPEVIRSIAEMKHEVGYHYEDLATAQGNMEQAMQAFQKHLNYFRTFYPVKTICMHGSSTTSVDNRAMWNEHALHEYELIGEPYLTTDFSTTFYMTDTGYAWDRGRYAFHDVAHTEFSNHYHTTKQVIEAIQSGTFPKQCLILAHTLWTDSLLQWSGLHLREFIRNHVKQMTRKSNLVKRVYAFLVNIYWKK